jgi:hypothetical protein
MKRLSVVVVITAVLTGWLLSGCTLEGTHVVGPADGPVFYDKGTYSNGGVIWNSAQRMREWRNGAEERA